MHWYSKYNILNSQLAIRNSQFAIQLALGLLLALVSCKPKEDIVLRNVRDIVVDVTTEPTLKAQAILYNPNNIKIKLRKIAIDVYVDGRKSGRVDQEPKLLIPAASEFKVPLEVKLNMKELGLLDTIFGIIGGKKLKVRYKGSISVTYKGLPIRVPVDYESEVRIKL
jgi:LEA14-like dessication related protein